jgi:hypothetical protein
VFSVYVELERDLFLFKSLLHLMNKQSSEDFFLGCIIMFLLFIQSFA